MCSLLFSYTVAAERRYANELSINFHCVCCSKHSCLLCLQMAEQVSQIAISLLFPESHLRELLLLLAVVVLHGAFAPFVADVFHAFAFSGFFDKAAHIFVGPAGALVVTYDFATAILSYAQTSSFCKSINVGSQEQELPAQSRLLLH